MNQSKFSIADAFTLLIALGFGSACFLSTNFYTLGDTKKSIVVASIIAVLLFMLAWGAKLLKLTKHRFRICLALEIILLLSFTASIMYFTYYTFSHYFVVSDKKGEIQQKLIAGIAQTENIFTSYEKYVDDRKDLYEGTLKTAVRTKDQDRSDYDCYGFKEVGVSTDQQIAIKMNTIQNDLVHGNYEKTKKTATIWLVKAKAIVERWHPINIVTVVNEVERESTKWRDALVQQSTYRAECEEQNDFSCPLSIENVKKYFTTPGKPTPLSIGLAAGAYLLMLLSWAITKRDSRAIGAFQTKSYEAVL